MSVSVYCRRQRGYEIVHPLTTEPWDLRRSFVRAPDGDVFNIDDFKQSVSARNLEGFSLESLEVFPIEQ